jgi:hypothetical protein
MAPGARRPVALDVAADSVLRLFPLVGPAEDVIRGVGVGVVAARALDPLGEAFKRVRAGSGGALRTGIAFASGEHQRSGENDGDCDDKRQGGLHLLFSSE